MDLALNLFLFPVIATGIDPSKKERGSRSSRQSQSQIHSIPQKPTLDMDQARPAQAEESNGFGDWDIRKEQATMKFDPNFNTSRFRFRVDVFPIRNQFLFPLIIIIVIVFRWPRQYWPVDLRICFISA